MARPVGANFFVRRIRGVAADVSDLRARHALQISKFRFDSPKASRCKCGLCHFTPPDFIYMQTVILPQSPAKRRVDPAAKHVIAVTLFVSLRCDNSGGA
jgi:hypothetical protein